MGYCKYRDKVMHCTRVLEVSCAMQELSLEQKWRLAKGWNCGLVDFGASRLPYPDVSLRPSSQEVV